MCGRFALFASGEEVAERFHLPEVPLFDPRYNIAPSQAVAIVRATASERWTLCPRRPVGTLARSSRRASRDVYYPHDRGQRADAALTRSDAGHGALTTLAVNKSSHAE